MTHTSDPRWVAVDNGHLVAWTCGYKVERIKAGGFFSGSHTGEGLVCRYVYKCHYCVNNDSSIIRIIASQALVAFLFKLAIRSRCRIGSLRTRCPERNHGVVPNRGFVESGVTVVKHSKK